VIWNVTSIVWCQWWRHFGCKLFLWCRKRIYAGHFYCHNLNECRYIVYQKLLSSEFNCI